MPSESTLKQYAMRLAILKRDGVETPARLIKWFDEQKLSPSSRKVYLSALKHSNPTGFSPVLQSLLSELYEAQNKKDTEQQMTDKQKEMFVPWPEIAAVQSTLAAKENKTDTDWKHALVASLYTLNAPVRADYGEMKVVKESEGEGNELVVGKGKMTFVFRVYKTAKTYGEVKIPVAPALRRVILGWFDHLGKTPTYLLGDQPSSPNTFAVYVAATFKKHTGKPIGVSMIRHSYIMDTYPSLKTIKQKDALAKRMLHSKGRQEMYNLVSEE